MADVPGTSPKRPIIWSPGCPATGSCRCPVDIPIQNFCIFVFPLKSSNRRVKQELLHLKNTFFIKLSIFFVGPLRVPQRSWTLRPLGDLQGTSPGRRMPAGSLRGNLIHPMFITAMSLAQSKGYLEPCNLFGSQSTADPISWI